MVKCKVKIYKNQEFMGMGYAEVDEEGLNLRFSEEDVAFMKINLPEDMFYSKIRIVGIGYYFKSEEIFEVPQYSVSMQLTKLENYN